MPSTTRRHPLPQTSTPPADLRLVNWPLRDDGVYGWAFVLLVVGVAATVGFFAQSNGTALLSLVVMSLAMWRMWIPVVFEIGPRGIHQTVFRTKRRIGWSAVKQVCVRRRGVVLLFAEHRSPLADALGLYIRWGNNKDDLLNIIRYYTGATDVAEPSSDVQEESQ